MDTMQQKILLDGLIQDVKVEKDRRYTTIVIKQGNMDLEIILSDSLAEFLTEELLASREVDCNYIHREAV
jgi:hypothetical protein